MLPAPKSDTMRPAWVVENPRAPRKSARKGNTKVASDITSIPANSHQNAGGSLGGARSSSCWSVIEMRRPCREAPDLAVVVRPQASSSRAPTKRSMPVETGAMLGPNM